MSAYSDLVLSHGASAYWRMNDVSGAVQDSVGSRHGVVSGPVSYGQPGRAGGETAVGLDATGTARLLPPSLPALGTAFTVEFWGKPSALPGTMPHFGLILRQISTDGDFQWSLEPTALKFLYYTTGPGYQTYSVPVSLTVGAWVHLVVTAGGGFFRAYVNGVAQTPMAGTVAGAGGATVPSLASWNEGGGETWAWQGAVSDVAIYPTALSAAQILNHYTVGSTVEVSVPSAGCDHTTVWSKHLATLSAPTVESERAYLATLYGEPGGTDFSTLVSRWLQAINCSGTSLEAALTPETVQTGTASAAAADTLTLTFPGATGNGRGMVVGVISSSSSALPATACSDNKGNTYTRILSQTGSANSLAVYLCPTGVGGPVHTVTIAPALGPVTLMATAIEVRGVGAGLALDASGSTTGSSSTPAATSTAVTSAGLVAMALMALNTQQDTLAVSTTDGQSPGWTQETEALGA